MSITFPQIQASHYLLLIPQISCHLPRSHTLPLTTDSMTAQRQKITPRKPKKRLEEAFSGQTATPPASASKGSRKLAPKISTDKMQNDSQDGHYGNSQTPTHHPGGLPFPSSSSEFFYPMSAPATAPCLSNTKPFWDPDASMSGMDLDFAADVDIFNTSSHRISNSFDWGRNNQMFQETVNVSQPAIQPEQTTTSKRQRPLAPNFQRRPQSWRHLFHRSTSTAPLYLMTLSL
jgi:hypothetical protein